MTGDRADQEGREGVTRSRKLSAREVSQRYPLSLPPLPPSTSSPPPRDLPLRPQEQTPCPSSQGPRRGSRCRTAGRGDKRGAGRSAMGGAVDQDEGGLPPDYVDRRIGLLPRRRHARRRFQPRTALDVQSRAVQDAIRDCLIRRHHDGLAGRGKVNGPWAGGA